jgi:hypothetical protein
MVAVRIMLCPTTERRAEEDGEAPIDACPTVKLGGTRCAVV